MFSAQPGDDADFPEVDDTPVEPLVGQPLEVQQTLEKIFELSDLQIEVRPGTAEPGMALRLGGADRKLLRQRNAELLLALQLLLNRMARRAWPEVGRIQLTTNGDNKSRDSRLVELTHGAAAEVTDTGRTKKLRPMNAYERRLVHLTIREYSGLTGVRGAGDEPEAILTHLREVGRVTLPTGPVTITERGDVLPDVRVVAVPQDGTVSVWGEGAGSEGVRE